MILLREFYLSSHLYMYIYSKCMEKIFLWLCLKCIYRYLLVVSFWEVWTIYTGEESWLDLWLMKPTVLARYLLFLFPILCEYAVKYYLFIYLLAHQKIRQFITITYLSHPLNQWWILCFSVGPWFQTRLQETGDSETEVPRGSHDGPDCHSQHEGP